jgi:hypothetical protein
MTKQVRRANGNPEEDSYFIGENIRIKDEKKMNKLTLKFFLYLACLSFIFQLVPLTAECYSETLDYQVFTGKNANSDNEKFQLAVFIKSPKIDSEDSLTYYTTLKEYNARSCEIPFKLDSEQIIVWYNNFAPDNGWGYKIFNVAPFDIAKLEGNQVAADDRFKDIVSVAFITLKKNPLAAHPPDNITLHLKFFNIDKERNIISPPTKELEESIESFNRTSLKKLPRTVYQVWGSAKYDPNSKSINTKLVFSIRNSDKRYLAHGDFGWFKTNRNSRCVELNMKEGVTYSILWLRNSFNEKKGWCYKIFEDVPFNMQKIIGSCIADISEPYINLRHFAEIKSCCTISAKEVLDNSVTINIKFINIEQNSKGEDIISPHPLDFDYTFDTDTMGMLFYVENHDYN